MASDPNPDILHRYGIERTSRSSHTRNFTLPAFVQLVELPDRQDSFCAVFLEQQTMRRFSLLRALCPGTLYEPPEEEDEPFLLAVVSTGDDSAATPYEAVRDWLQAHCFMELLIVVNSQERRIVCQYSLFL